MFLFDIPPHVSLPCFEVVQAINFAASIVQWVWQEQKRKEHLAWAIIWLLAFIATFNMDQSLLHIARDHNCYS